MAANVDPLIVSLEQEFGGDLGSRIWITRGCYFLAHDRLRRKARMSVVSTTMLSFYVIVLSILQLTYSSVIPTAWNTAIAPTSIMLSVFIIVVSLLESAREHSASAELSLRTAHMLEVVLKDFQNLPRNATSEDLATVRTSYSQALVAARTTRSTLDFLVFQAENPRYFRIGRAGRLWLRARLAFATASEYWIYALLSWLPPVLAALLVADWLYV